MNRIIRLLPLMLIVPLAGCEQTRPPTAEGIKKAKERTATGTNETLLEIITQPEKLVAGGVTIVNYKVFSNKIAEDGRRKEWSQERGFVELTDATRQNVSERLLRAWVVEQNGGYLAAIAPNFKGYASFLSDFTPPRPGKYLMFVEYQPYETNASRKQVILEREQARKELMVGAGRSGVPEQVASVTSRLGQVPVYDSIGQPTGKTVSVDPMAPKAGKELSLGWKTPANAGGAASFPEVVAISPDNKKLLHFSGLRPVGKFPTAGEWRIWFTYKVGEEFFAAPYQLRVAS